MMVKMLLILIVACFMLDTGQAYNPRQYVHEMRMSKSAPRLKPVHRKPDKGQGLQMKYINYRDKTKFKDCDDARLAGYTELGLYRVWFNRTLSFEVYCNHTATGSGHIIQQRLKGHIDFNQFYHQYVNGFGDKYDFWLGLQNMYYLTLQGGYYLQVQLYDFQGFKGEALYSSFRLTGSNDRYRLILGRQYGGNLVDDLSYNHNMQFATFNEPDYYNCALTQKAGWWYNYCSYALLNGHYYYGGHYLPSGQYYDGIYWKDWHGYDYSMKSTSMTLWKIP